MAMPDRSLFAGLDDSRAALMSRLRSQIAPILANNLLPHFTDHSIEHSDNLIRLAGELMAPLASTAHALNADELMVLYSACYLHDVGMQYERISELGIITDGEQQTPWQDLDDAPKRELLRRYHNVVSAKLVQLSATTGISPAPLGLVLDVGYQPARVAALCEAHCLETESERYRELTADGPDLRMGLLSGLLRVADILDESRRRATRERARTLDMDIVSQTHWWRHYYTESVTFHPTESSTFCLHFDFPPGRVDEYARIVPELQLPRIREELERHRAVFSKNGLAWNVMHRVGSLPYSTTETMPERVLTEMVKELQRRRTQEAEAQRAADLKAFDEARPLLRRQERELEEQRPHLSPVEYLRRLHAHARDRWALGGKRAACMMLRFPFERERSQLAERERVAMALELAGWLRCDGQADAARHTLELVQDAAERLSAETDLLFRYWHALAQCANESGVYSVADAAIERASSLACASGGRAGLLAENMEWRYLRGDVPEGPTDSVHAAPFKPHGHADQADQPPDSGDGPLCHLCPHVRFGIARCRLASLSAGTDQAFKLLEVGDETALPPLDRIAIDLCRAEILFLDGRADEALHVLDELAASAPKLSSDVELMILDNRTMVRFAELQIDQDFYERHDRRRLHGISFWDTSAVLNGMIDAEEGRHYDAVPAFWAQLCHAHRRMSWQGQKWAHVRLAHEFLTIGLLTEAAWHAMLALDAKAGKQIGTALRAHGDAGLVRAIIERLLKTARLHRHSEIACVILSEVMDLAPDDQVAAVSSFFSQQAAQHGGERGIANRLEAAWKALAAVVPRVDDQARGRFVRLAIEHPAWRTPSPRRRHLLHVAHHATATGIPDAVRTDLVEAALTLAMQTKSEIDYTDVLQLLCQLAQHDAHRARIGSVLFPADGTIGNVMIAQIAPLFGKHVTDVDAVAREASRQIRLQVQRTAGNQELEKVGYLTAECARDDQKIAVCVGAGEQHLAVVRRHKVKLSASGCAELVNAVLAMVSESDNDLSNRAGLVEALRDLADRFDAATAKRVAAVLRPLAEGRITESTVLMTSHEARHPLNRVSLKSSTPGRLRGLSILALTEVAKHHAAAISESLDMLMAAALTDRDPDVRSLAYAAAWTSSSLPLGALCAVLVGTQDSDSTVARVAWLVLAEATSPSIPAELWDLVVLALRKAIRHRDATLRQAAAAAAANLAACAASAPAIAHLIGEIVSEFQHDPCHSVRSRAR